MYDGGSGVEKGLEGAPLAGVVGCQPVIELGAWGVEGMAAELVGDAEDLIGGDVAAVPPRAGDGRRGHPARVSQREIGL